MKVARTVSFSTRWGRSHLLQEENVTIGYKRVLGSHPEQRENRTISRGL